MKSKYGKKPNDSKRSPHWPATRKKWLKDHPNCSACGTDKNPEVHHKQAFHLNPERELDSTNFITLCEHPGRDCHFRFGHFFDWKDINPHIEIDAASELNRIKTHKKK